MIVADYNDKLIEDVVQNEDLKKLMHVPIMNFNIKGIHEENKSDIVVKSRCQFNDNNELTLLGFINGILPELTNKVLVETYDNDGNSTGYDIVEKWWLDEHIK